MTADIIMDNDEYDDAPESDSPDDAETTQGKSSKRKRHNTRNKLSKKLKSAKFTKQPTAEELNRLNETNNLFSSNFFRMQIEEICKEVSVKPKYVRYFDAWLKSFNSFLSELDETENHVLSDQSWLDGFDVKLPIQQKPKATKGHFKFIRPKPATVIGSHAIGCGIGPDLNVDIKIEMPQEMFFKDDHLNDRYHRKRALYLTYLAQKLSDSALVSDLKYKLLYESAIKPILYFKPNGKGNNHINISLHVAVEGGFKLSRFVPSKSNVRQDWRFGLTENDLTLATPLYNSAVLTDLTYNANNDYLVEKIGNSNNIKEAIVLLKIWLKQRQIRSFSGFTITMFVAHLMNIRRINNAMSSYQVVRNVWTALAHSDLNKTGISLITNLIREHPAIEEFHAHFPVVFVDCSGFNNICSRVTLDVYKAVKHESELAIKFLDNPDINGFSSLFMIPVKFHHKFDHVFRIEYTKKLKSAVFENLSDAEKLDCHSDEYFSVKKYIGDLLHKGLDKRAAFITSLCLPDEDRQWSVDENHTDGLASKYFVFGIKLDPDFAFNSVDRGPEANLHEAESFRKFWGEKSELRRFQDGTICEACLWETSTNPSKKRLIVKNMIEYLLKFKFGVSASYLANQFEFILYNNRFKPGNFEFGTGEDASLRVNLSLDGLMKNLHSLTEMPLDISAVHGASAVFSYSDPAPPLPYVPPHVQGFTISNHYRLMSDESKNASGKNTKKVLKTPMYSEALKVVVQLSFSGKWPENLEAFRNIKAAFYIQIAEALEKQCGLTVHPHKTHVDVFKDGYVFQLEIAHNKEIALMKKIVDSDGMIKYRDTDESISAENRLFDTPKLRITLNGLYNQHQCYGPAVCMIKRWIRSHLIDESHFPDICVDMLMASVFLCTEPYEVPIQPQVAFWRCLRILATSDWNTQFILLNFNNNLKKEEILEIEANFSKMRSNLPPLYFVTPFEAKKSSIWSRTAPTFQILARTQILAAQATEMIDSSLFDNSDAVKQLRSIFTPNMNGYDIIIHLNKLHNPRYHQSLTYMDKDNKPETLQVYEKRDDEFIPVNDFDPVQKYLNELRSSYGDFALFFHDTYGGDKIAVIWKPSALEFKDFKISHVNGRKPIVKDGKNGLIADIDSILEGFCIIGEGIVENIENVSNITL